MNEDEIYEALGMKRPDQSQEEAPEGQKQAQEGPGSGQDGQQAQEPQDWDQDPEDGQEDGQAGPEDQGTPEDGGIQPQAEQKQAQQATAREQRTLTREALEEAVRQAVALERARQEQVLTDFLHGANLRNPVTGELIRDLTGLAAYSQAAETRRLERNLAEGKLTPEDLDALIRRRLAAAKPQEQPQGDGVLPAAETRQASEAQKVPEVTKEQVAAELAEIHRLDPAVNSLEDILKGPERDAFVAAVRRGNSFLDAFRLASFDRLRQQRQAEAAQRAAQAERNRSRGKEHMVPAGSRGQGAAEVPVPKEVMDLYRLMMPKAGEAEIRAHYAKGHAKDKDNI